MIPSFPGVLKVEKWRPRDQVIFQAPESAGSKESSWAITPSERSKSFIGNAGCACDKLSTQERRREGETKRPASRKDWHHSCAEVLGKFSMLLAGRKAQKTKFYRQGINATREF